MTDSTTDTQEKWNRIYEQADQTNLPEPCDVLSRYEYLLAKSGRAIDIACGRGGNALFLAHRGLNTVALDISSSAIEKLQSHKHPLLECVCDALEDHQLEHSHYDVVVVSRFLSRSLCDAMVGALKPGGLLFYQTFVNEKVDPQVGPSNPDYLLDSNELLSLFSDLRVVVFSDLAAVGDVTLGFRNQSFLVGQRRG